MCGIFCLINCVHTTQVFSCTHEPPEWTLCKDVISARGPDSLNDLQISLADEWHANFYASVLWMQGLKPISQPIIDNDSNILLWNGDVFSGNMFKENVCDTEIVLSTLSSSSNVIDSLKGIKGPFSFIYYHKKNNCLYFGRDRFGRHSLLFKINNKCQSLLLTSVGVKLIENIVELPAIGIFIVDLNTTKLQLQCSPWHEPNDRFFNSLNDFKNYFNINVDIIQNNYLPKLEKLFINSEISTDMGFLKYINSMKECKDFDQILEYLLEQETISQTVNNLLLLLNESVRRRVKTLPNFCKNCTKLYLDNTLSCQHAKVGLLFSGGLDSAILAVLVHNNIKISETIDLINIAFEKKNSSNFNVPDRITGRKTYNELLKICPGRKFNFIEVDVLQEELHNIRINRISNIVYPNATVLDDSLACAVWFASRAKGTLFPSKNIYESTCRVLLLGMGADEQFGGYIRHRNILKRKGWEAFVEELEFDFNRIGQRNLGRDDRMICDHGRQSRLPYLDEDLVEFVQKLPPWERCLPIEELPSGLGDKLLLRLVARKIKLQEAALFPKRAFQFGSRVAIGKENAADISKRL